MGEAASPVCFELAKRLKRAPRQIAQEIANGLGGIEGIAKVEVARGGYLNAYFDREACWASAEAEQSEWGVARGETHKKRRGEAERTEERTQGQKAGRDQGHGKVIVEHT